MTIATVSFEAKDTKGQNKGDYETFVDLSASGQSTLYLKAGSWAVKGIKLYQGSETNGQFTPATQKNTDMGSLNSGVLSNYQAVFGTDGGNNLPTGFSFTPANGNTPAYLTDPGSSPGDSAAPYEYLIWLQSTDGNATNDYADPGIRNRG